MLQMICQKLIERIISFYYLKFKKTCQSANDPNVFTSISANYGYYFLNYLWFPFLGET